MNIDSAKYRFHSVNGSVYNRFKIFDSVQAIQLSDIVAVIIDRYVAGASIYENAVIVNGLPVSVTSIVNAKPILIIQLQTSILCMPCNISDWLIFPTSDIESERKPLLLENYRFNYYFQK